MSTPSEKPVIQECLAALKSINRDLDLIHDRYREGRLGIELFSSTCEKLREKQIEIIRIMAEACDDPVGRWKKIIPD